MSTEDPAGQAGALSGLPSSTSAFGPSLTSSTPPDLVFPVPDFPILDLDLPDLANIDVKPEDLLGIGGVDDAFDSLLDYDGSLGDWLSDMPAAHDSLWA
jgi:hypothetical protein